MLHLFHVLLFSAILSVFFATLSGREGKRLKLGLILFAALAGGSVVVSLIMAPFT
jgi:hypothetical protein